MERQRGEGVWSMIRRKKKHLRFENGICSSVVNVTDSYFYSEILNDSFLFPDFPPIYSYDENLLNIYSL